MVLFDEVEKAHADVFNILLQASLFAQLLARFVMCPRASKPRLASMKPHAFMPSEEYSSFRIPQLSPSLSQPACRRAQQHDRLPDIKLLSSLSL